MFSSVGSSLAIGKMRQILLSQAAFGIILQIHRQLPVCIVRVKNVALGFLKIVTESIFKISEYIHGSKLNFDFQQQGNKKMLKAAAHRHTVPIEYHGPSNKNIS
jgi:hypothetical protein